jgi:hypothetical protein
MMKRSSIINRTRYHVLRYGVRGSIERSLIYLFFKLQYPYNRRRLSIQRDLPKRTYVDPKEIQQSIIPRGVFPSTGNEAFIGRLGGVWDLCYTNTEDTVLYRSMEERFKNGASWEETEMYKLTRWAIEHDTPTWGGCQSDSELQDYCRSLDDLFESIRRNGYVECSTTVTEANAYSGTNTDDEVVLVGDYAVPDQPRVGRSREGKYLRLSGGKHRIIVSRLLGIDAIPVVLFVEHERSS